MTLAEAVVNRHSVRSYIDREIEEEKAEELRDFIRKLNFESGLKMTFVTNEAKAFGSKTAHYGMFKGVRNYVAVIGKKSEEEKCGYFGQKLVLKAQQMGLNTCWVALTCDKSEIPCRPEAGEKILAVIAVGYGDGQGRVHKSKPLEKLCRTDGDFPKWFEEGMKAAMLAPTAVNQQRFLLVLSGNRVKAKAKTGFYTKMDLGIVKCNFEIGAGTENFEWEE